MAEQVVTADIEGGKKLEKYLRNLAMRLGDGATAKIGFLESATYRLDQGGMPVATVAFWNEFGTSRSPERPFFRNMIEDQIETWPRKLGLAARYSGYRSRQTLEIVAADIKGHLVESINMLEDPPLADSTIERKGFSKPLIDTAVMVRSVSWEVEEGAPVKE